MTQQQIKQINEFLLDCKDKVLEIAEELFSLENTLSNKLQRLKLQKDLMYYYGEIDGCISCLEILSK